MTSKDTNALMGADQRVPQDSDFGISWVPGCDSMPHYTTLSRAPGI